MWNVFSREPSDSRPREASIPISTSAAADPDRPSPPSEPGPSTALVPLAGADEDEMMEDVAQMAGGGQVSGQDALTNLEITLRPVEKYAVRFLEEVGFCVSVTDNVCLSWTLCVRVSVTDTVCLCLSPRTLCVSASNADGMIAVGHQAMALDCNAGQACWNDTPTCGGC